jgi:hypothetical protein
MPQTPQSIAQAIGLCISQSFRWGQVACPAKPGIYLISLSADPTKSVTNKGPDFAKPAIESWIKRARDMRLDGKPCTTDRVASFISGFWHPAETIVYIGKSKDVRRRLRQFSSHSLGECRPHAGGHWLKTLANLDALWVHVAECAKYGQAEDDAIRSFQQSVIQARPELRTLPLLAIPFANRRFHGDKQDRLTGEVFRAR